MTDPDGPVVSGGPQAAASHGPHRWTERQFANARRIEAVRLKLKLPDRAGLIATTTALVESSCLRLASRRVPASLVYPWRDGIAAGDHDSVGVFQQRAPWGSVYHRLACTDSARRFFLGGDTGQRGLTDFRGWQAVPLGEMCQRVQVSAFPDRYGQAVAAARDLRLRATGRSGGN